MGLEYYSHSRISLFRKCAKAFRYRYVDDAESLFPTTVEAHMGRCVHAAIAEAYLASDTGRDVGVDDLVKEFDRAWRLADPTAIRIVRRGQNLEDYRHLGIGLLKYFYEHRFPADDGETVAIERDFVVQLEDGSEYRGVIDRLARSSDGTVTITDFKTGKRVPHPKDDLQLRSYALHVRDEYDVTGVRVQYEDLRNRRTLSTVLERRDLETAEREIVGVIRTIDDASRYDANPSFLCRWCEFQHICEDADRGLLDRQRQ